MMYLRIDIVKSVTGRKGFKRQTNYLKKEHTRQKLDIHDINTHS
jgi:hypothetical protein